jgi:hypothetical protein
MSWAGGFKGMNEDNLIAAITEWHDAYLKSELKLERGLDRCQILIRESNQREDSVLWIQEALRGEA